MSKDYPKLPCMRRLTKEDDGTNAWRIQKVADGIVFRTSVIDKENGGTEEAYKRAAAFLALLDAVVNFPGLSLTPMPRKKKGRNPKKRTEIPAELVDKDVLSGLLQLEL